MRNWILRRLGVICGDFGGLDSRATQAYVARWCRKPFGHSDSCVYDTCYQPHLPWRLKAKGY